MIKIVYIVKLNKIAVAIATYALQGQKSDSIFGLKKFILGLIGSHFSLVN
jgi:hypothetical protein